MVAALSQCHMLWFLHLCSEHKIVVINYLDQASGTMEEMEDGSGRFSEVTLHPEITISGHHNLELINTLHEQANKLCFIANSCNFKVKHEGKIKLDQ